MCTCISFVSMGIAYKFFAGKDHDFCCYSFLIIKNLTKYSLWYCVWKWKWKSLSRVPTLCDPMDYAVHGILQARILAWVVTHLSRGSSQPRNWTQVSHNAGDSLPVEPPGKPKKLEWVYNRFAFPRCCTYPTTRSLHVVYLEHSSHPSRKRHLKYGKKILWETLWQ